MMEEILFEKFLFFLLLQLIGKNNIFVVEFT